MNSVGTCKWFNGFMHPVNAPDAGNERCGAGVVYKKAFGNAPGVASRAPCIEYGVERKDGRATYGLVAELRRKDWRRPDAPPPIPCGRRCEPTDEENDADVMEIKAHMEKLFTAMKVVGEWRVKPTPSVARNDVLKCPICSGRLHVWQSSYNGHCGAQCMTPDCINFQE